MERRRFLQTMAGGLVAVTLLPNLVNAQGDDEGRDVYAALRARPDLRITIGGGEISVLFANGPTALDRELISAWIRRSATAVSTYFGRFPVDRLGLLVTAESGNRIGPATTYGYGGSATSVHVGNQVDDAKYRDDWVLVHEMIHLALPEVPRHSDWLLEGNATYVEPIARAQVGLMTPQAVWRWAVDDMGKVQPEPDDQVLDHTHTWARTYWGGAMYWLMAEVAIYEKTAGKHRLQDALRAINRASGGNTTFWSVEQVANAGDDAVGVDVLSSLYRQMKDRPVRVDLEGILKQMGISEAGGKIIFDDHAPLAALRKSITSKPDFS
jgi:hypothetical protein